MNEYALQSYMRYIQGEDDILEALDEEFMEKVEKERENVVESNRALEKSVGELEAKAEVLRTGPTEREGLGKEKNVLEEDVKKFHAMIAVYGEDWCNGAGVGGKGEGVECERRGEEVNLRGE